jgi:hypothetical protein
MSKEKKAKSDISKPETTVAIPVSKASATPI